MTGLIVIDESGDLGSKGSTYFAIAALVMLRPRHLKVASKLLPNDGREHKWVNTDPDDRRELLSTMSGCEFRAVYAVINKNNPDSGKHLYGNNLYEMMLRQVLADAMSVLPCRDFNVFVDRSSFIKIERLREIAKEEAVKAGVNLMKCDKVTSEQNKCIQLVDYVAGAARARYEDEDASIHMIEKRISIARRY